MPIKQVVCSICEATVNKAQTYHVGGTKRACKTHEGVVQKKDTLESEKRNKAERKNYLERQHPPVNGGWSGDSSLKCWVCMNPGIRQEEYFMKILVEMEKQKKIHGIVNPLDPKYRICLAERCIFILSLEKSHLAMKYVREDFQTLVRMAEAMAICGPCCRVCEIDPMPPVNFDQLRTASVMYTAFLEPLVSQAAGQEMVRDN